MILGLLATLGAIVVAFVLYPVFTEAPAGAAAAFSEADVVLSDLRDKKAMLYDAIQDLDFEKAAGKVSDADYENARNDYLAQVAVVLEKLDTLAPPEPEAVVAKTTKSTRKHTAQDAKVELELECGGCGELNPKGSNFCLQCGKPLATTCASCGEPLPDNARFCNACGEKVSG